MCHKDYSAAAAAAAKSCQSCLTLCDPTDSSPPGSSIPGILQLRILEWVAISFSSKYYSEFFIDTIETHVHIYIYNYLKDKAKMD